MAPALKSQYALWAGLFAGILFLVVMSVGTGSAEAQGSHSFDPLQLSPGKKADFLLLSKQYEKAREMFQSLWQQDPDDTYAVRGIVRSHHALKQLETAKKFFEEYRVQFPDSSPALYGSGYVAYMQEDYPMAKEQLMQAVVVDPQNALAWNTLAAVQMELKSVAEALNSVKRAIQILPSELMFYRNLNRIYKGSGDPDQFLKEYDELRERGGNTPQLHGYGRILAQNLRQQSFKLYVQGNIDRVIDKNLDMVKVYREINYVPGEVAGLFSLAVLYEEKGDRNKAREYFKEVLKINPQHIQTRRKMKALEKNSE